MIRNKKFLCSIIKNSNNKNTILNFSENEKNALLTDLCYFKSFLQKNNKNNNNKYSFISPKMRIAIRMADDNTKNNNKTIKNKNENLFLFPEVVFQYKRTVHAVTLFHDLLETINNNFENKNENYSFQNQILYELTHLNNNNNEFEENNNSFSNNEILNNNQNSFLSGKDIYYLIKWIKKEIKFLFQILENEIKIKKEAMILFYSKIENHSKLFNFQENENRLFFSEKSVVEPFLNFIQEKIINHLFVTLIFEKMENYPFLISFFNHNNNFFYEMTSLCLEQLSLLQINIITVEKQYKIQIFNKYNNDNENINFENNNNNYFFNTLSNFIFLTIQSQKNSLENCIEMAEKWGKLLSENNNNNKNDNLLYLNKKTQLCVLLILSQHHFNNHEKYNFIFQLLKNSVLEKNDSYFMPKHEFHILINIMESLQNINHKNNKNININHNFVKDYLLLLQYNIFPVTVLSIIQFANLLKKVFNNKNENNNNKYRSDWILSPSFVWRHTSQKIIKKQNNNNNEKNENYFISHTIRRNLCFLSFQISLKQKINEEILFMEDLYVLCTICRQMVNNKNLENNNNNIPFLFRNAFREEKSPFSMEMIQSISEIFLKYFKNNNKNEKNKNKEESSVVLAIVSRELFLILKSINYVLFLNHFAEIAVLLLTNENLLTTEFLWQNNYFHEKNENDNNNIHLEKERELLAMALTTEIHQNNNENEKNENKNRFFLDLLINDLFPLLSTHFTSSLLFLKNNNNNNKNYHFNISLLKYLNEKDSLKILPFFIPNSESHRRLSWHILKLQNNKNKNKNGENKNNNLLFSNMISPLIPFSVGDQLLQLLWQHEFNNNNNNNNKGFENKNNNWQFALQLFHQLSDNNNNNYKIKLVSSPFILKIMIQYKITSKKEFQSVLQYAIKNSFSNKNNNNNNILDFVEEMIQFCLAHKNYLAGLWLYDFIKKEKEFLFQFEKNYSTNEKKYKNLRKMILLLSTAVMERTEFTKISIKGLRFIKKGDWHSAANIFIHFIAGHNSENNNNNKISENKTLEELTIMVWALARYEENNKNKTLKNEKNNHHHHMILPRRLPGPLASLYHSLYYCILQLNSPSLWAAALRWLPEEELFFKTIQNHENNNNHIENNENNENNEKKNKKEESMRTFLRKHKIHKQNFSENNNLNNENNNYNILQSTLTSLYHRSEWQEAVQLYQNTYFPNKNDNNNNNNNYHQLVLATMVKGGAPLPQTLQFYSQILKNKNKNNSFFSNPHSFTLLMEQCAREQQWQLAFQLLQQSLFSQNKNSKNNNNNNIMVSPRALDLAVRSAITSKQFMAAFHFISFFQSCQDPRIIHTVLTTYYHCGKFYAVVDFFFHRILFPKHNENNFEKNKNNNMVLSRIHVLDATLSLVLAAAEKVQEQYKNNKNENKNIKKENAQTIEYVSDVILSLEDTVELSGRLHSHVLQVKKLLFQKNNNKNENNKNKKEDYYYYYYYAPKS